MMLAIHLGAFGRLLPSMRTVPATGPAGSSRGPASAGRKTTRTCTGRVPAAFCGVVGLKSTNGLISRYAIMPRSWSQDTVGPLTRTAADCARMTRVIAGADPRDPTCSTRAVPNYESALNDSIKGVKVGVPANHYYDGATDEVRSAMEASLAVLRSAGARIREVRVPDPARIFLLSNTISISEAAVVHARWMRERPQDYSMYVRTRVEPGFHVPAPTYLEALTLRSRYLEEFLQTVYGQVDVLHMPVLGMAVPTIAETEPQASGDVAGIVARLTRNTRPTNYLGLPALSVPAGFSESGLPFAFQLMGRPFSEALLFRVAHQYQRETGWHERVPDLPRQ